jgi:predicted class III extradiol MEMO1 family dioxygenase
VALVLAKSLSTYFNPIGKICVDSEFADELLKQKAKDRISKMTTD